jgi:uncharacterized protein YuzE
VQRIIAIERHAEPDLPADPPVYIRFSHEPVAGGEITENPEVVIDFDVEGRVIGIELISTTPDEIEMLARVARKHDLDLTGLFVKAA